MQLSQIKPIREGITHIEAMAIGDFIDAMRNFEKFEISEKIDGSNLVFGYDEEGFYTSREGKGQQQRFRSEGEYEIGYQTMYRRSAHLALEKVLPLMERSGYLNVGDSIEIEILYGPLTNVVPHEGDINRIIFLRPITGNPDIKKLAELLEGHKANVQLKVPFTLDGRTQQMRNEAQWWEFTRTPTVDGDEFVQSEAFAQLKVKLSKLESFLSADSGIAQFSNAEAVSLPLNKRPEGIDVAQWKECKLKIKELKKKLYTIGEDGKPQGFVWEVKEFLLNNLVRKIRSEFGPAIADGGWIEGVVFRNTESGEMFKIVDKDMFMVVKDFLWQVRSDLSDKPKSVRTASSFAGELLVGLATSLGHPDLGTFQAKRILRNAGSTPDEIIANLSKGSKFTEIQSYWVKFLQQMQGKFDKILDKYNKEKDSKELEVHDRVFKYDGEVHYRTLQTFNVMNEMLDDMLQKTKSANSITDLYTLLVGRQLSSL